MKKDNNLSSSSVRVIDSLRKQWKVEEGRWELMSLRYFCDCLPPGLAASSYTWGLVRHPFFSWQARAWATCACQSPRTSWKLLVLVTNTDWAPTLRQALRPRIKKTRVLPWAHSQPRGELNMQVVRADTLAGCNRWPVHLFTTVSFLLC